MKLSLPADDGNGLFLHSAHFEPEASQPLKNISLLTVFPQRVITFLLYFLSALFLLLVQSRGPPKNHHNNRGSCRRLAVRFSCAASWPLTSLLSPACGKTFSPPLSFTVPPSAHGFLSVWRSCFRCIVCLSSDKFTHQSCHVHISHQSPAFYSIMSLTNCAYMMFSVF